MTDIIAVSIVWLVNVLILLLIIFLDRQRRKELFNKRDNFPLFVGLIIWEVVITILCLAVIIANLSV